MSKEIALKWDKQALHDLQMAEKNISIKGYDIAAFLAHQSVEKLMKSWTLRLTIRLPDILMLANIFHIKNTTKRSQGIKSNGPRKFSAK